MSESVQLGNVRTRNADCILMVGVSRNTQVVDNASNIDDVVTLSLKINAVSAASLRRCMVLASPLVSGLQSHV